MTDPQRIEPAPGLFNDDGQPWLCAVAVGREENCGAPAVTLVKGNIDGFPVTAGVCAGHKREVVGEVGPVSIGTRHGGEEPRGGHACTAFLPQPVARWCSWCGQMPPTLSGVVYGPRERVEWGSPRAETLFKRMEGDGG